VRLGDNLKLGNCFFIDEESKPEGKEVLAFIDKHIKAIE
jgi:hypothetical protein